jgi:hypothetical protein
METSKLLPSRMRIGEIPFANVAGGGLRRAEANRGGNASGELIMTMTAGIRFGHTVLALRLSANPQFLSRSELFPVEMAD